MKSVRRLGVLLPEAENDAQSQAQVRALEHGLTQLGWSPGKNLQIDYRWAAGDLHGTRLAAAELVRLAPDVLLAAATPPVRALQQATNTIPIVFAGITEPVAQGLVASLAHPGGNLTGFSNMEATFGEKWLELLKEIDPRVTRAAIVFNPQTAPITADLLHNVEVAAQRFAIQPIATPVQQISEIETAAAMLAREPGGGMILLPDSFTTTNRKPIIEAVARHRCLQSSHSSSSPPRVASFPMVSITQNCTDGQQSTLTAFSKAKSLPICRCSSRPNSNW